ncbi:MAG: RHS repeat-associated core domain-containing protein [Bacteroidota bacterium]
MKYLLFLLSLGGLLLQSTYLPAQNIPRENFSAPQGLQVNTYTGNLFYQRKDFFIPALGLPIDISFFYNLALRHVDQGFGYGWTFSYGMRYFFLDSNQDSVVVEWPNGRRDVHVKLVGQNNIYRPIQTGIFHSFIEVQGGQFELQTKEGLKYFFNDPVHRKISRIEDPNNNALVFGYTGTQLSSITDAANRSLSLTWNGGHLSRITDALEAPIRELIFSYDSDSQLVSVQNPAGFLSYTYGPDNELKSVSDENGNPAVIHYRSNAEAVSKIVSCAGDQVFHYHEGVGKTYVIENGQNTTTFVYDTNGNHIRKYGSCCGYDLSYQYDGDNNISKITDGRGNWMDLDYDSKGNLKHLTDPDQMEMWMTYDTTYSRLTSLLDRRGAITTFGYDGHGNLLNIHRPLGITDSFTYDSQGNLSSFTDGELKTTGLTYNANGDLTQINYPLSQENFTYDDRGNLLTASDGNGHTVSFSYDDYDQLIRLTDSDSNTYHFDYDPNGNLIWEVDGNGDSVQYQYDALDRLSGVITSAGSTYYHYDALSNLIGITNAEGHTTTFAYNDLNLVAQETDAMGFTTSYEYDPNGNLISKLDPNGHTTTYTYDKLNRLTTRSYPEGSDIYEYDANGNLERARNNHIDYEFEYDSLNRLMSKEVVTWSKTISYTYDDAGNRKTMTDPDGGVTEYFYDDNHRLDSLVNPFGQITSFAYDSTGRMTEQTNANGTFSVYAYDDADNLEELTHYKSNGDTLAFFVYTYDSIGYRTSMLDIQGLHNYSYDGTGRLTNVTYANGDTEDYSYDRTGNRTMLVKNGNDTIHYGYDAADRILFAGSKNFQFDNNGNMTKEIDGGDTTHYLFNTLNELVGVVLPGGDSVEYGYDAIGLRILYVDSLGGRRDYILDGVNVIQEIDNGGSTSRQYTAGLSYDRWLGIRIGGLNYVYHQDGLNSTVNISDQAENSANHYQYDIWGTPTQNTSVIPNDILYSGRYFNTTTSQYYYRSRVYSSLLGRFLSKDVNPGYLAKPSTGNKFVYVENNPVNFIDPNGELAFLPVLLVFGGGVLGSAGFQIGSQMLGGRGFKESAKCVDFIDLGIDGTLTVVGLGTLKNLVKLSKGTYIKQTLKRSDFLFKYEFESTLFKAYDDINEGFYKLIWGLGLKFSSKPFLSWKPFCDDDINDNQNGSLPNPNDPSDGSTNILQSYDPNEIIAPSGSDSLGHWVSVKTSLPYTILFENDPDSGQVSAQSAEIIHPIASHTDPSSFRLGDFGFANHYFTMPPDSITYQARLDVKDSLGVWVDVDFGIRRDSGFAYWRFTTIDTATGEPTMNLLDGFLPVNDSTHRGEGFVNFNIRPQENSQTGDKIEPSASITFDTNNPISTPYVFNTIDADPPVVEIDTAIFLDASHLQVFWSGTDLGAGLESYDIFFAKDDEPFVLWLDNTAAISAIFPVNSGSDYCFIARASDYTGNVGLLSDSCDLSIGPLTSIESDSNLETQDILASFWLGQNFPNPFGTETIIPFTLIESGLVRLHIYDLNGRFVKMLVGEYLLPGDYQITWDGTNSSGQPMASGVYVYRILVNEQPAAKQMLLLR